MDFRGIGNTTGTGTIKNLYGYRANNLQGQGSDAGRVTDAAYSFLADDISAGATETASFVSYMSSGLGKWAFLSKQGAPSAFVGNVRYGDISVPTDKLETNGYAKLSSNGTKAATGGYHESRQHQNDFIHAFSNTHASAPQGVIVSFTGAAPNNTSQIFLMCRDSAVERLRIYSNGAVANVTNSYGALSDASLKTDVTDAGAQLADIMALRVRKYRLISDGPDATLQIGLIAQEVKNVSPGLVSQDAEGIHSVAYSVLNVKLLKAVQELAETVAALADRVAELEGKN